MLPVIFRKQVAQLPATAGLYLVRDRQQRALWLGIAENLLAEAQQAAAENKLPVDAATIEAFPLRESAELPARYRQLVRTHQPRANAFLPTETGYPFLSFTGELFPRLQIVHRPEDTANGPVLPPYALPEVLERLTEMFRLRRCTEAIDGTWPLPCLEYFRKRCLAPCVRELCAAPTYKHAVKAARSLLSGDGAWQREVEARMQEAVAVEEFEAAAQWRDALQAAQRFAKNEAFALGLRACTDVFTLTEDNGALAIHLTTRRARKKLGELLFRLEATTTEHDPALLLEHLLLWHYAGELPRDIKLPCKVPHHALLQRSFQALSAGQTKLTATSAPPGVLARFAAQRALLKQRERYVAQVAKADDPACELQALLAMAAPPRCVQAYDVAHLAGQHTVASVVMWRAETPEQLQYGFHLLAGSSEPDAIYEAVRRSAATLNPTESVVLVDGGKTQLRRACAAWQTSTGQHVSAMPVIAAVKPAGQSHLISHFLRADESTFTLAATTAASRLLYRLRDAAHNTANGVHRQWREAAMLPALTQLLPELNETQRQALWREFGALETIVQATPQQLQRVLQQPQAEAVAQRLLRLREKKREPVENVIQLPIVRLATD